MRAHGGRSDWKKNHIYPLKKKLRGITSATLLRFSYLGKTTFQVILKESGAIRPQGYSF